MILFFLILSFLIYEICIYINKFKYINIYIEIINMNNECNRIGIETIVSHP